MPPYFQFPSDWDITHSPNHWSNEVLMESYLDNIIIPYIEMKRHKLGLADDFPALMIFDVFRG